MVFWIIYAIDRELIFPTFLDQIIPSLVNHILVSYKKEIVSHFCGMSSPFYTTLSKLQANIILLC